MNDRVIGKIKGGRFFGTQCILIYGSSPQQLSCGQKSRVGKPAEFVGDLGKE